MKRQPREVYGFGLGVPTRGDTAVYFARLALLCVALASVAAWAVW